MIFDAFRQSQGQSNRKYGGTGLGLTISRRLTQMMGGMVEVTSELEQGSTFTLIFPEITVTQTTEIAPSLTRKNHDLSQFTALKILIVDDVQSNRDLLYAYFNATPHQIIMADNGAIALKLAVEHHPDLILLDLVMPQMDGQTVLQVLKENPLTAGICVVMVTASIQEQDFEELKPVAQGFLRKPVSRQDLFNELQRLFPFQLLVESQPPSQPQTTTLAMSPQALEKLPELIELLQQEEASVWKTLHQTLLIDQLRVFALRLQNLSQLYECPDLSEYANMLKSQIDTFDLAHLADTVANFPEISKKLQKLLQ